MSPSNQRPANRGFRSVLRCAISHYHHVPSLSAPEPHLKWLLRSPLPQAALPRWNAVQRELVSRLADFGADPKSRDASRVLRLVSTCNTKQPDPELRKVRVLWVEEADGEPLLHDFERLAEAVLPFTRKDVASVEADKPPARVIQFKRGGESAQQARRFSFETLHWDRVTDMRKLRQLRVKIAEGGRETFVFLMLNELAKSGQVNAHNFQYETVALARECESFVKDSDWSRSTFSTLYRRVKEHMAGQYGRGQGLYKYQNQTLIEQLEITPDEERHMKTLISTTEKYRRNETRRTGPREGINPSVWRGSGVWSNYDDVAGLIERLRVNCAARI